VWEEKVSELISIASLIFVKWADSGPLGKEIELIKKAAKLNRTVFLLPLQDSPENLRHFLPNEPLFEIEVPEKPTDKQYAAFFTLTERGGQVHYRDRKAGYGEAARKVISNDFGMTDLSKSQIKVMRGFYGAFENLVSKTMIISLYAVVSAWVIAISLLVTVLIVAQLPSGAIKKALEDFFFGNVDLLLTGAGLVAAVSLVFLLILNVIGQRTMPWFRYFQFMEGQQVQGNDRNRCKPREPVIPGAAVHFHQYAQRTRVHRYQPGWFADSSNVQRQS
jgi:hypothetical protein